LAQQQRCRAALLAPPPEDLFAFAQLTRRDIGKHTEDVVVGKFRMMVAGSCRAVKHDGDQAIAECLPQSLHQLVEKFFVHPSSLPSARCSAAAGVAATEPAKSTVTRVVAAESTTAAAAPTPPAHHVTEDQPGQESAAPTSTITARATPAHQQNDDEDEPEN